MFTPKKVILNKIYIFYMEGFMDKRVFREFMKRDIVQKSIIFASAFRVSITKWYGSNENDKFPYRIYFYHGQNLVGYMDATTRQYGNDIFTYNKFPFEFFTPIGIMKGTFNSYDECFCYDIEKSHNHFDKVHGLFKIKTPQMSNTKDYIIGSYTKLEFQNDPLLHISFNNCVDEAEFTIESRQHFCEEVKFFVDSSPRFVHYNYLNRNQEEKLAEITISKDDKYDRTKVITAKYDFPMMDSYQDIISRLDTNKYYAPIWSTIREIDLRKVWVELEKKDPRLLEFINEVREEMIIYSDQSKPVSLYDRMATLSFDYPKYQNSFYLTRAQKENLDLENNPVLKRMREYKK